MSKSVLVLDLDGTLIRGDITQELLILCARRMPLHLPYAILLLIVNRSKAKRFMSERLHQYIDPALLPYEPAVFDLVEKYRKDGHKIGLVSGTDEILVEKIAGYLGLDFFKGSTPGVNLTAHRKAKFLTDNYGENFIYAGNSKADFAVWKLAEKGYGINAPGKSYRLRRASEVEAEVEQLVKKRGEIRALFTAMHPQRWALSLLIFLVPLFVRDRLAPDDWRLLVAGLIAFSVFSSATYILDDLFDIADDRAHHSKHARPLASGALSIRTALIFLAIAFPLSIAGAFVIAPLFGIVTIAYGLLVTAALSRLKRVPVLNIVLFASLFVMPVLGGAAIAGAPF